MTEYERPLRRVLSEGERERIFPTTSALSFKLLYQRTVARITGVGEDARFIFNEFALMQKQSLCQAKKKV